MSGYLQFYGSSNVVSEVAERLNSAGSAYHHTEYWSDADVGEKSHSDKIQDALNSADEHIATLESELAQLRAEVEGMREDAERLDWYEREHTLHGAVECTYVVDGYHLALTYDGAIVAEFHGDSIRSVFDLARKEADRGN